MDPEINQNPFPGAEDSPGLAQNTPEALLHLKARVQSGTPWHLAILEAIGLWTQPQEEYQGRTYRYLIQGEAFDWLVLAERLCAELDCIIPVEDKESLLFYGRFPETVGPEEFRDLLGANKHRAYLNYWYGVVVEEALQLSVEEAVRKRHIARCYSDSEDLIEEAYAHIYEASKTDLIEKFREEVHLTSRQPLSLSDNKEFTYWLHKRRIKIWDPARVASDTNKGMKRLALLELATGAVPEKVGA
jgi:hypothetical protein